MSDHAGVTLLAHIDAIHLDDALSRVEAGSGGHCACGVAGISTYFQTGAR